MTFLNTNGMALFGPGSEWLWAMIQAVTLLVSGLAIFRQLRAQGSANALALQASLLRRWDAPDLVLMRIAALIHLEEERPGLPPTYREVGDFFAYIASLWTHHHASERDLWEMWSGRSQFWWALAEPHLAVLRARNQGIYGEFEAFAKSMAELDRKNGVPNFDPAFLPERRRIELDRLLAKLRLQNDAQQGILPMFNRNDGGDRQPTDQAHVA